MSVDPRLAIVQQLRRGVSFSHIEREHVEQGEARLQKAMQRIERGLPEHWQKAQSYVESHLSRIQSNDVLQPAESEQASLVETVKAVLSVIQTLKEQIRQLRSEERDQETAKLKVKRSLRKLTAALQRMKPRESPLYEALIQFGNGAGREMAFRGSEVFQARHHAQAAAEELLQRLRASHASTFTAERQEALLRRLRQVQDDQIRRAVLYDEGQQRFMSTLREIERSLQQEEVPCFLLDKA